MCKCIEDNRNYMWMNVWDFVAWMTTFTWCLCGALECEYSDLVINVKQKNCLSFQKDSYWSHIHHIFRKSSKIYMYRVDQLQYETLISGSVLYWVLYWISCISLRVLQCQEESRIWPLRQFGKINYGMNIWVLFDHLSFTQIEGKFPIKRQIFR